MRCYKCGSFLTDGDTCPQCGENVRIYKKTARVSDAYYNAGLYKARVRDLTGAVESLKISLMINKYYAAVSISEKSMLLWQAD